MTYCQGLYTIKREAGGASAPIFRRHPENAFMSNKATGSPLASRSPLNVVLAGYGAVGRLMHAPLIRHVDGLNLYAIVSSRPAAVYADYPGMCVPESLDRALADPQVDMVVIATPNDSHAPLGLQVLTAGRHLVIDKPATLDAGQARELATEAHARGLMFSVFHNRRWDADFLTLSRLVAKGTPGPLSRCHLYYDRFRPEVQDRWRERPGPGSGSWFDLGAHLIDQALLLFGPPEAVWADLAALREGGEALAVTPSQVIEVMRVIDAGLESSCSRCEVAL